MKTLAIVVVVVVVGCGAPSGGPDGSPGSDGPEAADGGVDGPGGADAAVDAGPSVGTAVACGTMFDSGPVLLDLGHAGPLELIRQSGDRVLSVDLAGRWRLLDLATRTAIAGGVLDDGSCLPASGCRPLELAGATVLIRHATRLEVRASGDGALLATHPATTRNTGVAADGSYVWAATSTGLRAWAPDGTEVVNRPGSYQNARPFAVAGELRVASGPAGAAVIENVAVPGGASTTTPAFAGVFHSWFVDGARFITTAGSAVRVYTSAAVSELFVALDADTVIGLVGQGEYLRVAGKFYAVDGGAVVGTYTIDTLGGVAAAGARFVTWDYQSAQIRLYDLGGANIVQTTHSLPLLVDAAGLDPGGTGWSAGSRYGAIYDDVNLAAPGGPLPLSCGEALAIAGTPGGRVAIATAAGPIVVIDLTPGSRELVAAIPFTSSQLQLSADGATLVAQGSILDAQYALDTSLRVFALPAATEIDAWPYTYFGGGAAALARSGTRLGRKGGTGWIVTDLAGTTTYLDTDQGLAGSHQISPDGTRVALRDGAGGTLIFTDGNLVGAIAHPAPFSFTDPLGWLDDSRLLVQHYQHGDDVELLGTSICDPAGNVIASPALPSIAFFTHGTLTPIDADHIFVPLTESIYSVVDGSVTWTAPGSSMPGYGLGPRADVAGDQIVTARGDHVELDAY